METTKFIHWQDGDMWLGYLAEYPVYMTQGETFDELKENLKDLYKDLTGGVIPCVRKVAELCILPLRLIRAIVRVCSCRKF